MNYVTVTSTATRIDVDFGDYYGISPEVNAQVSSYLTISVDEIWKVPTAVYVRMRDRREWKLGITQGADNFVISSVNGIAPTDISHLYTLLKNMI